MFPCLNLRTPRLQATPAGRHRGVPKVAVAGRKPGAWRGGGLVIEVLHSNIDVGRETGVGAGTSWAVGLAILRAGAGAGIVVDQPCHIIMRQ